MFSQLASKGRKRDLLGGDEFEQGGRAVFGRADRALDRRDDFPWFDDSLAVAAERPGKIGVLTTDVGAAVFFGRRFHNWELDRHREVVEQHGENWNVLAHGSFEVHPGESDRRVAPDVDAEMIRAGELGAHRQTET